MSHWEKGSQPRKGNAGVVELASLLARGYLRLLAAVGSDAEFACNPPPRESLRARQVGLDTTPATAHELDRGLRP